MEKKQKHIDAVNRKRRIIVQEDGNMPFEALGIPIEKWVEHRFDLVDAPESQIDTICWDVGLAEDSYAVHNNSSFLPPVDHPGFNKWREEGIDWVKVLVDETHKRGLDAFWNHRIAAVDFPQPFKKCDLYDPARKNAIKEAHPDWVNKCWWPQGLWNLASTGLREHKLKFFKELFENYDFDGLQIDFSRHTPCLPPGKEWENREHATEFVRMVRKLLLELEQKKNMPLILSVKVAENIEGCHKDGFEVECWADENLVDIFTLGGRTSTVDIEAFKKITKERNIRICPAFDGHHTNDGYYFPPMEYFRGVFSNWWKQGADSVAVFNWTCAREEKYDKLGLPGNMKSVTQRLALFEIGCPKSMDGKERIYAVERRGGYPWAGNYLYRNDEQPLPVKLKQNEKKTYELPIYIYDDFSKDEDPATLDLIFWNVKPENIMQVILNGQKVELLNKDSKWRDGQVYCDKPQPNAGSCAAFPITDYNLLKMTYQFPVTNIKFGENIISITLNGNFSEKNATIEKVEVNNEM